MPRLAKGQVAFGKEPLPLKTCHDIRLWTACSHCHVLGTKNEMVQSSDKNFWHGRCFARKFGTDRLVEMPGKETAKLSLGDLGVDLMRRILEK